MPEIGASLREARMRAGIDISELEAETKIRAKYLRALENEEWGSLPGSTYVKSFLRTYADALGLDGRLLVEEFKLRHENLSDVELQPIAPRSGTRDGRRGPRQGSGRGWAIAAAVVVLVAALYLLGQSTGGGGDATAPVSTSTTRTTAAKHGRARRRSGAAPRSSAVSLELVATGTVYVCLEAAGSRILVPGQILASGQRRGPFRSRKFRMALGNGNVVLRVNGRALTVPPSANAIGYAVTPRGRTAIAAGKLPTCKA